MRINSDQLDAFNSAGYVPLRGAVPGSDVQQMCDRLWRLMAQQGIRRNDPDTWGNDEHAHRGIKAVSSLRQLKQGEPTPEDCPIVRAALDAVFQPGERASAPNWGQVLVTLPVARDEWLAPASIWHFDHYYDRPGEITGVNLFLLMDDVEPGGGATAVVRNSPLLMDRLLCAGVSFDKISNQNRGFCASHPWLRGLKVSRKVWNAERNAGYMGADTDIDGIPARVVELTGAAGDVFLCHPALLHAPAMNVSSRPRLMRTQRIHKHQSTIA